MSLEQESVPYFDSKGDIIDFRTKRLKFWLETVPGDIRRFEYELWKRYRTLLLIREHGSRYQTRLGRFKIKPEFTSAIREEAWEHFQNSFLSGNDRLERFDEIIDHVETDLPQIFIKHSDIISEDKVTLVAISGSSFYGPRHPQSHLSDIDIHFLLDQTNSAANFEVFPKVSDDKHYHLVGTGKTDASRESRNMIHWLLYPHYPIINKYNDNDLGQLIEGLIVATHQREDDIIAEIKRLDDLIELRSKESISE